MVHLSHTSMYNYKKILKHLFIWVIATSIELKIKIATVFYPRQKKREFVFGFY